MRLYKNLSKIKRLAKFYYEGQVHIEYETETVIITFNRIGLFAKISAIAFKEGAGFKYIIENQ